MSLTDLQLLIKPAGADCNLKCEYCFYLDTERMDAERGPRRMSDRVLGEMVRQTLAARMTQTVFGWQGGEPTLCGLEFFERAVGYMRQYGRGGQSVGNSLQTNGVLVNEDWAKFLAHYQFLVGVSIDGPADHHNHYRVNHAGKGRHDAAVRAAHLLEEHDVPVNVLTVVNDKSRADQVYPFLRREGFRHLQFIPCVERGPDGKTTDFSVSPEGYGRFLCDLFDLWMADDYNNVCIRTFDGALSRLVAGRSAMCVFDERCDQYVVVEYNGDVFPCDFFVRLDRRLGNLLETPLAELAGTPAHEAFAEMKGQLAPKCGGCRHLAFCHGGCPKYRIIGAGTHRAPTYFCESYLMFFDHALPRLKVLADRIRVDRLGGPLAAGAVPSRPPSRRATRGRKRGR